MSFRVEWVRDAEAFAAVAPEWEPLAERRRLPFMRHEWLAAWWASFGEGKELAVCLLRDGVELAAGFPLYRRGALLHALANEHTPRFAPLARDAAALRALCAAVVEAAPSELVAPLPADDAAVGALTDASAASRRAVWLERFILSPYVERCETFEDYRALLDRSARKETERRHRRIADAGGTIAALVRPTDAAAELDIGLELEASGWKGSRGTAIVADAATRDFYHRVARAFDERGRLVYSWVRLDDRPVAFTFGLVDFDRVWSLKFGMADEYRRHAPGIVSTYADIREVHERGLEGYELLGDFEPYKRRFTEEAIPHVIVRSYRRRPLPLARVGYRRFVRPRLKAAYGRLRKR